MLIVAYSENKFQMDEEDQEVIDDDYHKLKDDYQISNHIWNKLYKSA